jgi:hypothetical protein
MFRSWEFNWSAEGRAPRTMREMQRFILRFETLLAEDERDLLTATRQDCEAFVASHSTPVTANWAWRSLRSFYALVAEELETPHPW